MTNETTIKTVVCSNAEIALEGVTSPNWIERGDLLGLWCEIMTGALDCDGMECSTDSVFENWSGGRYSSHHAAMYGHDAIRYATILFADKLSPARLEYARTRIAIAVRLATAHLTEYILAAIALDTLDCAELHMAQRCNHTPN